ncbi:histidine kinase [Streptomyces albidoflavus]|uniref:sensor histidine kinase n=1 Tax=Streptomyces albidoflavus TaxID=1886 RepID=UPI0033D54D95
MPALLQPLTRAVTYTRWCHLLVAAFVPFAGAFIHPGLSRPTPATWAVIGLQPVPLVLAAALIPAVRRAEGLQARLMLFPGAEARVRSGGAAEVSAAPSASWSDRARTGLWLVLRMETGFLLALVTGLLMTLSLRLAGAALGGSGDAAWLGFTAPGWVYGLLAPLPLCAMAAAAVAAGALAAGAAGRLLGPSGRERLAALEERTERLLEHQRIARELHDSIGHALTLSVVQAGAARATGSAEFTARALETIEETGRAALEDLERVLRVLRTPSPSTTARPDLTQAERLFGSARAAGAEVDAELTGALDRVPGPVSREGYRILQEALTNVVRHAGPVPVRVTVTAGDRSLLLEVTNPPPATPSPPSGTGGGSGVEGIRERAALLGGRADAGWEHGHWVLRAELPCGDGRA